MQKRADFFLLKLNVGKALHKTAVQTILALSLAVILVVFWGLKLTGITMAGEAFCGKDEHTHSEACSVKKLICTLEETESHTHSESCLQQELICGLEESEEHTHTPECMAEPVLCCGREEVQGHTHGDECYEVVEQCPIEEHIHIESCYSNLQADLETSDDWDLFFADLARGPTLRENLVLVAQTQLGYTESTLNFQVDEQGVRRGITRYGQWYGNPYGDWSAMFVSFCMEYAGASDLPMNSGPESMRQEWEAAERYRPVGEYTPQIGDLLFLSKETQTNTAANAVAIITEVSDTAVTVIEGDVDGAVAETVYPIDDPQLIGYGLVPEMSGYAVLAAPPQDAVPISTVTNYNTSMLNSGDRFVFFVEQNGNAYAFDGNGNAVEIYVDGGMIYTDLADPNQLLWTFERYNNNSYAIRNVGTGRYLHPFYNSGSDNGITTPGRWGTSVTGNGSGINFSHSAYIQWDAAAGQFRMTRNSGENVTFQVGQSRQSTVWLDGTDGGMGHLTGSPNTAYSALEGSTIRLPETWTSPSKYSYKLRGWYDVTNSRYYPAGAEMEVTGDAVLYADWVASTYDIGVFNAQVADTVSTNEFITTHMFDYNYLFNVQSANAQVTVDGNNHSENWSMVSSGNADYGNRQTLDYVFSDSDREGQLSTPNNRSYHNVYHEADTISFGIYTQALGEVLFSPDNGFDPATGTGIIGKTYLGTGDYLFQLMDDPADEHYGYYYYDSKRNAASYNQSQQRFYVYDYLSATSDAMSGTKADFIPLNSPYANTNGKNVGTYSYAGVDGEYQGVTHYRFDTEYSSGDYNSANNVTTDFAYGMRSDIHFYLPNDPGTNGNKDLNGNDMEFQFSGDDDLWVLIDGIVVLDIGGIHQSVGGNIDFSTGEVVLNGNQATSLMDLGITAGDHVITVLYLERGASMSNCSIYFNLAPRYSLELQKEDVLTQKLLNGAQFTIYEDFECTKPAELWTSEEAYKQDLADGVLNQYQSTVTVENGIAALWGFGSGNTYYIKETKPPDAQGYGLASGVIRLTIKKDGLATYSADVITDAEGNAPSNGYTIHGVHIDEATKKVYITVTNAPETVVDTTTVEVIKKWEDHASHSGDYINAYLTVTDPDGTVRRIREILLSDENDWTYIWTNLPEYDYDAMTKVQYGIEESYESGYYSTVRKITQIEISKTQWAESLSFQDGETYILRTANGYLSTQDNRADTGYKWVNEETAKTSPNALWTTTISGGKVKFTNGVGQTITFYYNGGSPTDFYATSDPPNSQSRQEFNFNNRAGALQIFYQQGNNKYYLARSWNNVQKFDYTTNANNSLLITPIMEITQTDIREVEDWAYQITNTPLEEDNETAFHVRKEWVIPEGFSSSLYQEFAVTVRLYANGVNTGRTVTLNLKNNWQASFLGLPYKDQAGNVIQYTVEEIWSEDFWTTANSGVISSGGSPPIYSSVITNSYHPGGPELPSTGSAARLMYVLCGAGIMLGTLVYGIQSRRKRERRMK